MGKTRLLIVYESSSADLTRIASRLKDDLSAVFDVMVKPARDVTPPDVQAARAFAFGADLCDAMEWAALSRLFPGINLSGRCLSVFHDGSKSPDLKKAEKFFSSMIADSGLVFVPSNGAADASWISTLTKTLQS